MPKSKRAKAVSLTATDRKPPMARKTNLVKEIRSCVDSYKYLYVFEVLNEQNRPLKELRNEWSSSRFFMGKNKVMALALGKSEEDEYKELLRLVGEQLTGHCGLLFTESPPDDVKEYFEQYRIQEFATAGFVPEETIVLKEGPMPQFGSSIEPFLRQLGLKTELNEGIVHLLEEKALSSVGVPLTPGNAKILRLLGIELAEFHLELRCVWTDGTFTAIDPVERKIAQAIRKDEDVPRVVSAADLEKPKESRPTKRTLRTRKRAGDERLYNIQKEPIH